MRRSVEGHLGNKVAVESLDDPSIAVKIDNGTTLTLVDKTIGARYRFAAVENYDAAMDDGTLGSISNEIIGILENRGFKETDETSKMLFAAPRYRNGDIICEYATGSSIRVGCSLEGWISKDQKQLMAELAEAYKKKQGSYPIYIYADKSKIVDSPIKPYQRLDASIANAGATFYRTSNTAEWKFGLSGQRAPSCDEKFDDDLRKAIYGKSCFNEADGSIGTIK